MAAGSVHEGYLALADISGFTSYLAGVELDHAHEILSDLLELVVSRLAPLLTLSKLEGDAVFTYAPASSVPGGETLLNLLEGTYFAFKDRVEAIQRRTTCLCKACRSIPALDLKFMVHFGSFILQQVAGRTEVIGSDVNMAHRLMKNHVGEATGWRAYALFSQAAMEHMGIMPECVFEQVESYEHLGEVRTLSLELMPRYRDMKEARRVFLEPKDAFSTISIDYPAPPPVLWAWTNQPSLRGEWMTGTHWSAGIRPGGRNGVGARNHCAHGKSTTLETILDWRPFDYVTSNMAPFPGKPVSLVMSHLYTPLEKDGTHLQVTATMTIGNWPGWANRLVCQIVLRGLMRDMERDLHQLKALLQDSGRVAEANIGLGQMAPVC
jgi:hypothetical protein